MTDVGELIDILGKHPATTEVKIIPPGSRYGEPEDLIVSEEESKEAGVIVLRFS